MSTTCLTIYDLLRITYTYEAQALQAQSPRKRSDSACSVSRSLPCGKHEVGYRLMIRQTPETCSLMPTLTEPTGFATLETDFTQRYSRPGKR
jgi:hypothetical protein